MEKYDSENWVTLYKLAIVELEHAKMSGRIESTQIAIVARLGELKSMPGMHTKEQQAIEDALSGLRVLAAEEARFDADQKRRAVERALEKLRSVAPAILNTELDQDSG